MQDKMIVQEELADFFGSLINHFEKELDSVLYIKSFFVVISDEWSRMDRWRMDKFLMVGFKINKQVSSFICFSNKYLCSFLEEKSRSYFFLIIFCFFF